VGYTISGIPGALIATIGEVTPSIIVILLIAALLKNFRENRYVDRAFYGLRPASTGLIGSACVAVILEVLACVQTSTAGGVLKQFQWEGTVNWRGLLLVAVLLVLTNWVPRVKTWHPIVFIAFSAVIGVVFHFAGV